MLEFADCSTINPENYGLPVESGYVKLGRSENGYLICISIPDVNINKLQEVYTYFSNYPNVQISFQIITTNNNLNIFVNLPKNSDCEEQISKGGKYCKSTGRDLYIGYGKVGDKDGVKVLTISNKIGKTLIGKLYGGGFQIPYSGFIFKHKDVGVFKIEYNRVQPFISISEKIKRSKELLYYIFCAKTLKTNDEVVAEEIHDYIDIYKFILETKSDCKYTSGAVNTDGTHTRKLSSKEIRLEYLVKSSKIAKERLIRMLEHSNNNIVKMYTTDDGYVNLKVGINGAVPRIRTESITEENKKERETKMQNVGRLMSLFNTTEEVYDYINNNNLWAQINKNYKQLPYKQLKQHIEKELDATFSTVSITRYIESLGGKQIDRYRTANIVGYRFYSDVWEKE